MHRTLIVDDDKHQQGYLSGMLSAGFPAIDVVDICSSVQEGVSKIKELKPELVFLDVMMPPKTGFDLLAEVGEINFDVIFTTSFEEFALRAFKVSAVDYLLKPFSVGDLRTAIDKFEKRISLPHKTERLEVLMHNISDNIADKTKIALPTAKGMLFVQVSDIVRCEGDNNYTHFFMNNNSKLLVSKTLSDCESLLLPFHFFRVHKAHLINMREANQYIRGDGGSIIMSDGSIVELSRTRKAAFLGLFPSI